MPKRVRNRVTAVLTDPDRELLERIAAARGLTISATVRELVRGADPEREVKTDDEGRPPVATYDEVLELLTTMARKGDRQAVKELLRLIPKTPVDPAADEKEEPPADPAARFRSAMKGGLRVVEREGA